MGPGGRPAQPNRNLLHGPRASLEEAQLFGLIRELEPLDGGPLVVHVQD
jgi:hypothetical protein